MPRIDKFQHLIDYLSDDKTLRGLITRSIAILYINNTDDFFTCKMDHSKENNKLFIDFIESVSEIKYDERDDFLLNGGLEKFIQLIKLLDDYELLCCYDGQLCQYYS
jgi:hypothetical protein